MPKCSLCIVADVDVEPIALKPGLLQRNPRLLRPAVYALTVAIFAADMRIPQVVALSMLYTIPILVSLWIGRQRFTLWLSVTCGVLTLFGLFRDSEMTLEEAVGNALAAIFSIGMVASLGLMRLRTERELTFVRKVATTTLRSLGEAVLTINEVGEVRFVNSVACDLLGRANSDLVGRLASDVFIVRDLEPTRPPLLDLVERGVIDTREAVLFAFGGRRIAIEYVRTPILNEEGGSYGEVVVFRDITVRKEHEEAIKRLAYRDDLTGLPNRVSLSDRMQLELAHARRNKEQLGVAYVDLDGFKETNDRFGHDAGDALLRAAADRMRSVLRAGDTIARLGGDEFVLLLPGIGGPDVATLVGQKIIAAIEEPVLYEGVQLLASASLGIALYPRDGEEADMLLRRADKAMYRAKSLGRGNVQVYLSANDSQFLG